MNDITKSVAAFREAARHLWNTFFYPDADWDDRDRFSEVCVLLFDALVIAPTGRSGIRLPQMYEHHAPPMDSVQVVPRSGITIMINRATPPVGYWDDPVTQILPSDGARFAFVAFFDFAELDRRDFKYLEVVITALARHPHLVGRRALVEFDRVGVFLDDRAQ
jgi:hypothetical protein